MCMWNSIVSLYYKDNTDDSIRSIQYELQRVYYMGSNLQIRLYVLLFLYMLIILSFHNVWIISLKSFHVCEIKNPQCTYTNIYTYVILQTFR